MGYGTKHLLRAEYRPGTDPETAILELVGENEEAAYALTDSGDTNNSDAKWYEHERDLLAFSLRFPHLLFTLKGWGASAEDIWVKYFQNGAVQVEKAKLTLGEFDPSKLKKVAQAI